MEDVAERNSWKVYRLEEPAPNGHPPSALNPNSHSPWQGLWALWSKVADWQNWSRSWCGDFSVSGLGLGLYLLRHWELKIKKDGTERWGFTCQKKGKRLCAFSTRGHFGAQHETESQNDSFLVTISGLTWAYHCVVDLKLLPVSRLTPYESMKAKILLNLWHNFLFHHGVSKATSTPITSHFWKSITVLWDRSTVIVSYSVVNDPSVQMYIALPTLKQL